MSATPPPAMSYFIPCDLAPGLSLPYPSRRFTTPQATRPAPSAITSVCNTVIAELKNAILIPFRILAAFKRTFIQHPFKNFHTFIVRTFIRNSRAPEFSFLENRLIVSAHVHSLR